MGYSVRGGTGVGVWRLVPFRFCGLGYSVEARITLGVWRLVVVPFLL